MAKYYAGVGSRKTPQEIQNMMTIIAAELERRGYILRSGGADSADSAFAKGASNKHIYIPWRGFNNIRDATLDQPENWTYEIAEQIHPAWHKCTQGAKKLHARNVHQILGDTKHPEHTGFVLCWTPEAKKVGGTATAIALAEAYDIPVFNLANHEDKIRLDNFIDADKYSL